MVIRLKEFNISFDTGTDSKKVIYYRQINPKTTLEPKNIWTKS